MSYVVQGTGAWLAARKGRIKPGTRIAMLTVEDAEGKAPDGHINWRCRCDCGATAIRRDNNLLTALRGGVNASCGCSPAKPGLSHGMRGRREYSAWQAAKQRCHNPENKDFPRWGGRGIAMCQRWRDSFEAFFSEMGVRPAGMSLDRIDATKGYEPGNCRWATASEQQRNRRTSYRWFIKGRWFESIDEAARAHFVSTTTIVRWCEGSHDARRGTTTPPRADCYRELRYK